VNDKDYLTNVIRIVKVLYQLNVHLQTPTTILRFSDYLATEQNSLQEKDTQEECHRARSLELQDDFVQVLGDSMDRSETEPDRSSGGKSKKLTSKA
jgi:hypothetical protein